MLSGTIDKRIHFDSLRSYQFIHTLGHMLLETKFHEARDPSNEDLHTSIAAILSSREDKTLTDVRIIKIAD